VEDIYFSESVQKNCKTRHKQKNKGLAYRMRMVLFWDNNMMQHPSRQPSLHAVLQETETSPNFNTGWDFMFSQYLV
jgi:hypothetical protein